ncbi:DUF5995 family protein [Halopenitus salinus]|uniref:DUF5995 family protein n=1 Tax=Halopenitus salinus TaxID=1198295 RepID=A0ABD5US65_9EURY
MAGYTDAARLIDGDTLRAVRLAIGGDLGSFSPPPDPDPALVDVVDRPFESVEDAADRLSRLESRLRERGDRRAVFLTIYARMTREVHDGIEGGIFRDPTWMRRYVIAFANHYRRAFLAFERGELERVPDPWRIAFATAVRGDALVVQDAVLGVNAHINYDLALAIDEIGMDPNRADKHADHRAINGILARLVDVQQDALAEIYAAGIDDVDAAFGRLDEAFTLLSMTEGREQAWRIATVLTDVHVPPIASYARWVLWATATGGAFFALGPRLDPTLRRTLHAVESEGTDLDTAVELIRTRLEESAATSDAPRR